MSFQPRALGSQASKHQASRYFSYLALLWGLGWKWSTVMPSNASMGTMYQRFSWTRWAAMKSMSSLV